MSADTPGPGEGQGPFAGDLVGRFRIERLVGQGGFGEVFLARDPDLGRRVALKLLRPDRFASSEAVEHFLAEARTTARFCHPHIVAVYEVGTWQGRPWLALEYLEGQDLRARMDEGQLGTMEVVRIGLAVAEALAEAHRGRVLHRDLKPANVMIPRDGRIRVVDFGEARRLDRDRGELCGTPGYLAPEQWRGERESPAVDVWALGIMLYECLSGERPHQGLAPHVLALRVGSDEPIPLLPASDRLPPALVELVERCLDKDPVSRPTANEIAQILTGVLEGGASRVVERRREHNAPYRGLLPYAGRDQHRFYGREQEIGAFLERLRQEAQILLSGTSGSGKTSFLQAGVVPRLREQGPWITVSMRPGRQPFLALAAALAEAAGEPVVAAPGSNANALAAVAAELAEAPGRLRDRLRALAAANEARVLVLVDQLEELFTHLASERDHGSFLRALGTAADHPADPIRVVLALRDDFLGQLATMEQAGPALGNLFVLRPPGPDALREIILRPLADAGFRLEDETQAALIVDEVLGASGCLPVLQAACGQLWQVRDATRRVVPASALTRIGGVSGALARHADAAVEGLAPARAAQARTLLLRLVTPEGTRRVVARDELLEGAGEGAPQVLDRLVRGRVVLARRSEDGDEEGDVELIHESLVAGWDRLRRWLEEARDELRWMEDLEQAAHVWARRGEHDEELWSGAALEEARTSVTRLATPPSAVVARFLERAWQLECERRSERLRGRLTWLGIVAGVAAASALLAAFVVGPMYASRSADRLCGQASAQLEGTWDDAARARLLAWADASESHASASAIHVSKLLDGYANAWAAMREDACLATFARGEQSAELYDRRVWCLDRRLGELGALTEILMGPVDEPAMDEFLAATWMLTPLAVCADVEALSATVPPPESPALREALDTLGPALDAAVAHYRLGDYGRARQLTQELVSRSAELGYLPFEAEVLHWLTRATAEAGDAREAEALLLQAIELASAARDDHLAAEGWVSLLGIVGVQQGRYRDALLMGRLASAQVHRAGDQPFQRVRLLAVQGQLQAEMDLFDQASASFDEAHRILQEQLGTEHPEVAGILEGMGWLAIGQAEYDRAEELFQRALEVRTHTMGPEHPKLAVPLDGIGKARFRAGRYDPAWQAAERALELRRTALGPDHPSVGVSIGALGPILRAQGDFEGALARYQEALAILEADQRAKPGDLATVLNNLGTLHGRHRQYPLARQHYERALAVLTEAYGPDHSRLARVLDNLGTTYQDSDERERMRRYHERALTIRERAFGAEHYDVARSLFYLAICHTDEDRFDEALALFERCRPVFEDRLGEHRMIGFVLTGHGEALVGARRLEEAIGVLERALALRERLDELPVETAETRFHLARALAATDGDAARVEALIREAREAFEAGGESAAPSLEKLERWVAVR